MRLAVLLETKGMERGLKLLLDRDAFFSVVFVVE